MKLQLSVVVLATVLWASSASAHELPGSTATVTLRDGLVTVEANLDIEALMRAQTTGELTAMTLAARKQAELLEVRLDGLPLPMKLTRFPNAAHIHQVLQRPQGNAHNHPKIVQVNWQAQRVSPTASQVTIAFPPEFGQILVSFVEPRSQLVAPGVAARFRRANSQTLTKPNKLPRRGTDTSITPTRLYKAVGSKEGTQ